MHLPGIGDTMVSKTFDLHLLKIYCGEVLEWSALTCKHGTVGNRSDGKMWLLILSKICIYLSTVTLPRNNPCLCMEENLEMHEKSLLKPFCLDTLARSFGVHISITKLDRKLLLCKW